MEWLLFILVIIIAPAALAEFTHTRAMNYVKYLRKRGDTSCGIERTWYGWRVREYAEGDES